MNIVKYNTFKSQIDDSVGRSACYLFSEGASYELGFAKHSGMVMRALPCSITEWLYDDLSKVLGKTCVIDFVHKSDCTDVICGGTADLDLRESTVLGEILVDMPSAKVTDIRINSCTYIPSVAISDNKGNGKGAVDIIYCRMPEHSGYYDADFSARSNLAYRLQLSIHMAACKGIDNVVVAGYAGCLSEGDVELVAKSFKDIMSLYSNYISNVFYLAPGETNYAICKNIFGR